ncbi:hypothetical protein PHYBLDRAFT_65115 [Phycomyces blakesleeanus NRRL 1555(-)]|uniref:Uncharacterized protein n=1 Tax=Phycomyces blakesleeanus (strain ATCC 8743b / DSM 1359 / FGSC 10004 / NBRC 33097 / NRRL 1555) TaxID=763407 RepID=A0A167MIW6_PHYB8|nr:hypothetical protein PHYBLDRAFT_65115 [Phycomyces blakesleeanus NRRL 1555(-)]OAD72956.1 hypothetical protein PHYBLDRAFT_65115 [Phycomyces blakesleeanus NRRL 1555(-)]|eukprot:XP_018290996.1 hypothetical protein PHYBLDRAFT_65115 [Phycomyces blakesleeanus NRRL 1555(-)]
MNFVCLEIRGLFTSEHSSRRRMRTLPQTRVYFSQDLSYSIIVRHWLVSFEICSIANYNSATLFESISIVKYKKALVADLLYMGLYKLQCTLVHKKNKFLKPFVVYLKQRKLSTSIYHDKSFVTIDQMETFL